MYICAVSAIFNTPTYFVIVYELPHPYKNIELSIFVHQCSEGWGAPSLASQLDRPTSPSSSSHYAEVYMASINCWGIVNNIGGSFMRGNQMCSKYSNCIIVLFSMHELQKFEGGEVNVKGGAPQSGQLDPSSPLRIIILRFIVKIRTELNCFQIASDIHVVETTSILQALVFSCSELDNKYNTQWLFMGLFCWQQQQSRFVV